MTNSLDLALLGNPEVRLAGHPLARLRSAKAYALLYYLSATRRTQPRTVLAGLFWGDDDEYYARRNLNRTLSDVTKAVGDHLTVERQSVALARNQPYWLDIELLEAAIATQPTAANVTTLAAAANLYRGDFLTGFYLHDAPDFEQWVVSERTRLRTGVLQLHHALADFYAAAGDLLQAMEYARRSLQLEPWREESHRQLMLFLAQSGQRSAALAQFELCCQALRTELDVEPDGATLELVARIRAGAVDRMTGGQDERVTGGQDDRVRVAASPAIERDSGGRGHPIIESSGPPVVPHNLPLQRTAFIGRAAELADITRLLTEEDDCRLLTVVGPGGMGKTRLAIKAAEQIVRDETHQGRFADGIFFVSLENVSDANGLAATVTAAVTAESGVRLHSDRSLQEQMVHALRGRAMLLVLDNFEHLVIHADLCSTLLAAAPNVKLLVTSREALGLQEAWFYPLGGLTIPADALQPRAAQEEYDAVRLFVQCARRTRPDFALAAERAAVLRICTLVEGMPLGIELAATWLKVLSCEQIAQEITHGIDFLTVRFQNIPARHRSMRAVMDHSWTLLAPAERDAIARLAIFRGTFRQEAATAITGASLFMLVTLVDKALVRVTAEGYYQMHELTRQYAAEQLRAETAATLRDTHAIYYAGLLDGQRAHLFTAAHRQVWATVGGELDNIRHAWQWVMAAVAADRLDLPMTVLLRQMAIVLANYYLFQSLTLSGQALFTEACQVAEGAGWATSEETRGGQSSCRATLVHLQLITGLFHFDRGHYRESLAVAEQAVAACRTLALAEDLPLALLLYGRTQMRRGEHTETATALLEALALGEQWGVRHYSAEALTYLGMDGNNTGLYAEARAYLQRGLALWQEIGYQPWVARTLTSLGTSYIREQAYAQALPYYEQALAIAQAEGDQTMIMINTSNLGSVQYGFRNYQVSLAYYQQSLAMARTMSEERWIAANLNGLSITALAMGDLPTVERALQEALTVGQRSDSIPDTLGSLMLWGHLFARRGQVDRGLQVLTFVEQHPATMARDKLYNQPLLAELRSELAPEHFAQAEAWAANQTVDGVVEWLLHASLHFR